jgi:hypothetical protein
MGEILEEVIDDGLCGCERGEAVRRAGEEGFKLD